MTRDGLETVKNMGIDLPPVSFMSPVESAHAIKKVVCIERYR